MPAPRPPKGACATHPHPELWDPTPAEGAAPSQDAHPTARLICLTRCVALYRCRRLGLARRAPDGVWGGLSPAERARIHADTTTTPTIG